MGYEFRASKQLLEHTWEMLITTIFQYKNEDNIEAYIETLLDRSDRKGFTDSENDALSNIQLKDMLFEQVSDTKKACFKISEKNNPKRYIYMSDRSCSNGELRGALLREKLGELKAKSPDLTLRGALEELLLGCEYDQSQIGDAALRSLFGDPKIRESIALDKAFCPLLIESIKEFMQLEAFQQVLTKKENPTDKERERLIALLKKTFDATCQREKTLLLKTISKKNRGLLQERERLASQYELDWHSFDSNPPSNRWYIRRKTNVAALGVGGLLLGGLIAMACLMTFPPLGFVVMGIVSFVMIGALMDFRDKEKKYGEYCNKEYRALGALDAIDSKLRDDNAILSPLASYEKSALCPKADKKSWEYEDKFRKKQLDTKTRPLEYEDKDSLPKDVKKKASHIRSLYKISNLPPRQDKKSWEYEDTFFKRTPELERRAFENEDKDRVPENVITAFNNYFPGRSL
jgi:hypothetical protein